MRTSLEALGTKISLRGAEIRNIFGLYKLKIRNIFGLYKLKIRNIFGLYKLKISYLQGMNDVLIFLN